MRISTALRFGVFALGLVGAAPLFAQDTTPPPPAPDGSAPAPAPDDRQARMKKMMERQMQQWKDKLGLTDDQVSKITDIVKAQGKAMQDIRNDDSLSDDDKRDKFNELRKSTREQVRAILTPDQQKIFDTLPPLGRRRPPPDGGTPPPAPPPPAPADAPPAPSSSPPPASN
jgi:Spy/CpxP family protein refolding chaperone